LVSEAFGIHYIAVKESQQKHIHPVERSLCGGGDNHQHKDSVLQFVPLIIQAAALKENKE
jgi:hypothetical protein